MILELTWAGRTLGIRAVRGLPVLVLFDLSTWVTKATGSIAQGDYGHSCSIMIPDLHALLKGLVARDTRRPPEGCEELLGIMTPRP